MIGELPPCRALLAPEGGWKEQTHYVVEVAFFRSNPVHRRILYVGFVPDARNPLTGGYTSLLCRKDDDLDWMPTTLYYLKPVCEIPEMKEEPF